MGRKSNPDVSYLDIEKSFYKKKGKLRDDEVQNVPFDVSDKDGSFNSENQLNLVRPVPKKGVKFNTNDKPNVAETKKPTGSVGKAVDNNFKGSIPNVILRKPTTFKDDEDGARRSPPRLKFQPNLSLKMGKQQDKDKFSDMTLLRKPEPIIQEANETKNSMEESPKSKNCSLERELEHKADSVIGNTLHYRLKIFSYCLETNAVPGFYKDCSHLSRLIWNLRRRKVLKVLNLQRKKVLKVSLLIKGRLIWVPKSQLKMHC